MGASPLTELTRSGTVLLQTRRRNGTWVPTPVNVAVADGRGYLRTYHAAGKAKRLRNFPEVRVAPSTLRGRPLGPAVAGRAVLLTGPDADRARAALAARFPVLHGRVIPLLHRMRGWRTLHYELTVEPRTEG